MNKKKYEPTVALEWTQQQPESDSGVDAGGGGQQGPRHPSRPVLARRQLAHLPRLREPETVRRRALQPIRTEFESAESRARGDQVRRGPALRIHRFADRHGRNALQCEHQGVRAEGQGVDQRVDI